MRTEYRLSMIGRFVSLDTAGRRQVVDRSFVLRLYSALEMKTALREAGFTQIDILEVWTPGLHQNALSLVARAA